MESFYQEVTPPRKTVGDERDVPAEWADVQARDSLAGASCSHLEPSRWTAYEPEAPASELASSPAACVSPYDPSPVCEASPSRARKRPSARRAGCTAPEGQAGNPGSPAAPLAVIDDLPTHTGRVIDRLIAVQAGRNAMAAGSAPVALSWRVRRPARPSRIENRKSKIVWSGRSVEEALSFPPHIARSIERRRGGSAAATETGRDAGPLEKSNGRVRDAGPVLVSRDRARPRRFEISRVDCDGWRKERASQLGRDQNDPR